MLNHKDIQKNVENLSPFEMALPQPLPLTLSAPSPGLALGGDLKSAPCAVRGAEALLFKSLGDLEQPDALRRFLAFVERIEPVLGFKPEWIACDAHPGYHSTRWARHFGLPVISVQHHHAHIEACKAEHGLEGPTLGLAADGTGLGSDNSIWGCELLLCDGKDFERVGHLLPFPIPPGDSAATEIWRPAAAVLHVATGAEVTTFKPLVETVPADALSLLSMRLAAGKGMVACSSLGRLFDAAAFILGVCRENRHEAEAAMALEKAATGVAPSMTFNHSITIKNDGTLLFDWRPIIMALAARRQTAEATLPNELAAAFHHAVAALLVEGITMACAARNLSRVVLSGGCFLNAILKDKMIELLVNREITVYTHSIVPPGDGGIALGQVLVAIHRLYANRGGQSLT